MHLPIAVCVSACPCPDGRAMPLQQPAAFRLPTPHQLAVRRPWQPLAVATRVARHLSSRCWTIRPRTLHGRLTSPSPRRPLCPRQTCVRSAWTPSTPQPQARRLQSSTRHAPATACTSRAWRSSVPKQILQVTCIARFALQVAGPMPTTNGCVRPVRHEGSRRRHGCPPRPPCARASRITRSAPSQPTMRPNPSHQPMCMCFAAAESQQCGGMEGPSISSNSRSGAWSGHLSPSAVTPALWHGDYRGPAHGVRGFWIGKRLRCLPTLARLVLIVTVLGVGSLTPLPAPAFCAARADGNPAR